MDTYCEQKYRLFLHFLHLWHKCIHSCRVGWWWNTHILNPFRKKYYSFHPDQQFWFIQLDLALAFRSYPVDEETICAIRPCTCFQKFSSRWRDHLCNQTLHLLSYPVDEETNKVGHLLSEFAIKYVLELWCWTLLW